MKRGDYKMPQISASQTLLRDVPAFVPTGAASDDALASEPKPRAEDRIGWQRIIDNHLVEWGRHPSRFDSDEIIPPSRAIIHAACHVAMRLRDAELSAPLRVVPDGDGGIAFEHDAGEWFQTLHLQADGSVELLVFRDCRIARRERLPDQSAWIQS